MFAILQSGSPPPIKVLGEEALPLGLPSSVLWIPYLVIFLGERLAWLIMYRGFMLLFASMLYVLVNSMPSRGHGPHAIMVMVLPFP